MTRLERTTSKHFGAGFLSISSVTAVVSNLRVPTASGLLGSTDAIIHFMRAQGEP